MHAAVIGLLLAAAAAHADDDIAARLERTAVFWEDRGRHDLAEETWKKLLAHDASSESALSALAVGAARHGAGQDELEALRRHHPSSRRIAPLARIVELGAHYDTKLEEARVAARAGRTSEAVDRYRALFGPAGPPDALTREFLETLAGTETGWEQARRGLERLVAQAPTARNRFALARVLTWRPSSRAAGLDGLQAAAGTDRDLPGLRDAWREALSWLPADRDAAVRMDAYLRTFGPDPDVEKWLSTRQRASLRTRALRDGHTALAAGRFDDARRAFETAGGTNDADAVAGRGLVALRQEQFESALSLFERAQRLAPTRPELWTEPLRSASLWAAIRKAQQERSAGRADAAKKLLDALLERDPQAWQARMELAWLALDAQDAATARALLQAVLEAQPDHPPALRALVEAEILAGRVEAAEVTNEWLRVLAAEVALDADRVRSEALRRRAIALRDEGRDDEARTVLSAAVEADPRNGWALHDLADVELATGALEAADAASLRLLAREPDLGAAHRLRARVLAAQGRREEALALLDARPDRDPALVALAESIRFEHELSRLRSEPPGRVRRALTAMEARATTPDRAAAVARAWAHAGEVRRGIRHLETVLARDDAPDPAGLLALAALVFETEDDDALDVLLKRVEALPRLTSAQRRDWTNLRVGAAVRRAERLLDTDPAAAWAQLAPLFEERPDDVRLLRALAHVFHHDGAFEPALRTIDAALRASPDDVDLRSDAVEIAWAAGQPDEARRLVHDGLARRPDDPQQRLLAARVARRDGNRDEALRQLHEGLQLTVEQLPPPRSQVEETARARFGGPAAGGVADELRAVLEELRRERRIVVSPRLEVRHRAGASGFGALDELRLPTGLSIPTTFDGRLTFEVTPVVLSAGALSTGDRAQTQLFGTGDGLAAGALPVDAAGTALALRWELRALTFDLGTTPLGFLHASLVGGVAWQERFGPVAVGAELSRRAVTDSVLSYAGEEAPGGRTWGGVVREGGRVDVAWLTPRSALRGRLEGGQLAGTGVASNWFLALGGGSEWLLLRRGALRLLAGTNADARGYAHNRSLFTLGHGGYFSPQLFVHAGTPLRLEGGGRVAWAVTAEPGLNWFRQAPAPLFPLDPEAQAARAALAADDGRLSATAPATTSTAFAFDLTGRVTVPLGDALTLGLNVAFHRGADYAETTAGATFGWALDREEPRAPSP